MTPAARKIVESASRCGSLAVAGMSKNAGKTESLCWLLSELADPASSGADSIAVTSVGVDGESVDAVTNTSKPEIRLQRGMLFATAEDFYRRRRMQSEVLGIGEAPTPAGRVVEARALERGKVILAGPSDMAGLRKLISALHAYGARTVIVDGALSRLSLASPAVTEALLLATGAALSPSVRGVVDKTAALCRLIALPAVSAGEARRLEDAPEGICAVTDSEVLALGVGSALTAKEDAGALFARGNRIFVPGAISDRLLKGLSNDSRCDGMTLICRDFSRIFATPETLRRFRGSGGRLMVVHKPELVGITVNPTSPAGFRLDSDTLTGRLREAISPVLGDIPVIDPKKKAS